MGLEILCSNEFVSILSNIAIDSSELKADIGLHGGGLHIHGPGGKLNVHMDYSLHPKLKLQRKLNLLIYMTPDWNSIWGGSLGLYGNENDIAPGELIQEILPVFNRAILFDVTKRFHHFFFQNNRSCMRGRWDVAKLPLHALVVRFRARCCPLCSPILNMVSLGAADCLFASLRRLNPLVLSYLTSQKALHK